MSPAPGLLRRGALVVMTTLLAAVALAGPASADPLTITATVGPVPVTGLPLSLCMSNPATACTPIPPAAGIALTVSLTLNPGPLSLPTIALGRCSNGQGLALIINTGPGSSGLTGVVGVSADGVYVLAIPIGSTDPSQPIVIAACVLPGVGIPLLAGLLPVLPVS